MNNFFKNIISFVKYLLGFIILSKRVGIMMYHSVENNSNKFNNVKIKNFERQLKFLRKNKYNILKLKNFLEIMQKKKILNSKNIVITFDDGDKSLYLNVFPILKKYQIPVTIFLISGFIGKEGYLKKEEIVEMYNSGLVDFGAHTVNHHKLHLLSKSELTYEINTSKKDIENILGVACVFFAYPKGKFNDSVINEVVVAGFEMALTVLEGYADKNSNLLELPRLSIDRTTSWVQFLGKISGLQFIKYRI